MLVAYSRDSSVIVSNRDSSTFSSKLAFKYLFSQQSGLQALTLIVITSTYNSNTPCPFLNTEPDIEVKRFHDKSLEKENNKQ